jgi:hypothetical protein
MRCNSTWVRLVNLINMPPVLSRVVQTLVKDSHDIDKASRQVWNLCNFSHKRSRGTVLSNLIPPRIVGSCLSYFDLGVRIAYIRPWNPWLRFLRSWLLISWCSWWVCDWAAKRKHTDECLLVEEGIFNFKWSAYLLDIAWAVTGNNVHWFDEPLRH